MTSNRAALPELTADAALAIDPESVEALTEAMARSMTDKGLGADLRLRGLERSRQLSWAETARRTLEVYYAALWALRASCGLSARRPVSSSTSRSTRG